MALREIGIQRIGTVRRHEDPRFINLCDGKECIEVSKKTAREMLRVAEETRKVEEGFFACFDLEKADPRDQYAEESVGEHCVGNECFVEFKQCQKGTDVASFHTHPRQQVNDKVQPCQQSSPSEPDLGLSLYYNHWYDCVSGPDTDLLTCYRGKDNASLEAFDNAISEWEAGYLIPEQDLNDDDILWQGWPSPECDGPGVEGRFQLPEIDSRFYTRRLRDAIRPVTERLFDVVSVRKTDVQREIGKVSW